MARQHYCPDYPDQEETSDGWREGASSDCPYHKGSNTTLKSMTKVRMSGRDRGKADKAAGVVGQDRGGYING